MGMANRLKMAVIETIHTLRGRGWSARRIARELGVDRETVTRHLRAPPTGSNAAIAPLGPAVDDPGSNAAIAPLGSGAEPGGPDPVEPTSEPTAPAAPARIGRPSECAPYRTIIVAAWERDLSARRIFQDLVAEHGFAGSYYSVRRFVRQLGRRAELPVRRMECEPGDECQVDFGRGAPVVGADGKRQATHVLRVVLSHSRKGYSEVVLRQTTEAFVRCLENAFRHFGGVPRRVVLDNLRAAVTRADWFDPELNPKVEAFGRHYGMAFWPTKPYTPRHKGKVERGVGYVKNNALKGRTFAGVAEQNVFLQEWERTVADTRIHGTTRRQVGPYFTAVEKSALLPLPPGLFPSFEEGRRVVNRDGHVEVERAFYSVPPEYLGRRVWVRWDGRVVRVFNDRQEQVALHPRHEPGRFSTLTPHVASEKVSGIERGAAWMLSRIRLVGPHCAAWAEACLSARGVEGVRALQGLLSLTRRHTATAVDRACEIAHTYSAYRVRIVRRLLDRAAPVQLAAFLDDDPLIRPLSDYTRFVHAAVQQGAVS
jgi:transposase